MVVVVCMLASAPAAAQAPADAPLRHLEARLLDGRGFSLAAQPQAAWVVVFWAPDSLASRKSLTELQRFATANRSRGVATIAVATGGERDEVERVAGGRLGDVPVALAADHDFGALPEAALPITFILDRRGRAVSSLSGLFNKRLLENAVAPVLAADLR